MNDSSLLRARSWVERLAQIVLGVALLWCVGWVFARVAPVLAPVFGSFVLAYFLDPLITRMVSRGINRTLAISFVFAIVAGAAGLFLSLLAPMLITQVGQALRDLPTWAAAEYAHLDQILQQRFGMELETRFEDVTSFVSSKLQAAAGDIAAATADSVGTMLNLVLIPIFTFYFLRDFKQLIATPLEWLPARFHPFVVNRFERMDRIVGEWVRGQVQVGMIMAVLYAVGLSLAGVRSGAAIGVVAGLLNVVPYLGAILGFSLSVLMAVVYGENMIGELAGIGIVFAVVQGLEGYLITPKLVGEKVGMSPLTVMIVLLLGGSLFGFFGLLFAIPCVAAGSVIFEDLAGVYRQSSWFSGERPPRVDASPLAEAVAADVSQPVGSESAPESGAPSDPPHAPPVDAPAAVPTSEADSDAAPAGRSPATPADVPTQDPGSTP